MYVPALLCTYRVDSIVYEQLKIQELNALGSTWGQTQINSNDPVFTFPPKHFCKFTLLLFTHDIIFTSTPPFL